jgi:Uncharacterized conserved protein
MRAKLGMTHDQEEDGALIDDLLTLMVIHSVDYTSCFRALSSAVLGDAGTRAIALRRALRLRRLGGALAGTAVVSRR